MFHIYVQCEFMLTLTNLCYITLHYVTLENCL